MDKLMAEFHKWHKDNPELSKIAEEKQKPLKEAWERQQAEGKVLGEVGLTR